MSRPQKQKNDLSDITPPWCRSESVAFADLPEDFQCLIGQFVLDYDPDIVIPAVFAIGTIPVANLPKIPLDRYDRGIAYARAMDPTQTPPILIARGYLMDGKHRIFSARQKNIETLRAIDLTAIIPARAIECNHMGPVSGFSLGDYQGPPKDQPKSCAGSAGTKDSPPCRCTRSAQVQCPACLKPLCLNHAKTITDKNRRNRELGFAGKRRCARCQHIDTPENFSTF